MLLFQGLFALVTGAGVAAIGSALGGAEWANMLLWILGGAMGAVLATILLSVRALLDEPLSSDHSEILFEPSRHQAARRAARCVAHD